MIEFLLFVLLTAIVALIIKQIIWKSKNKPSPPGPWGLPLVGHLLQLGTAPHKTLMKWKSTYGPLISIRFGSFPTVAISDYKLLRRILNDSSFAGRPDIETFKHRSGGVRHGILFGDGPEWIEQRRFTIKNLREFGCGKKSMESILQNEVAEVIEHLLATNGEPVKLRPKIVIAVINSLWIFITGERFEYNDATLHCMINAIEQNLEKFNGLSAIAMFLPWFTNTFPKLSGFEEMTKDLASMLAFLEEPLIKHRESIIYGTSRDLLDAYLNEIKNCEDPNSSFHKDGSADTTLLTVCLDLFTAGAETTTTSLTWMFLYLALYPEIQAKVHAEIDSVIGKSGRMISLDDKPHLPYLDAVIHETLRFSTLTPTGLFKNTLNDVELEGYFIPKNTMIITNVYDAHFDEAYWGDPHVFKPERFLKLNPETGKLCLVKHEPFLAFLAGKRSCLGEELARAELFIFSCSLLQRFNIETDPNVPKDEISIEPIISTVVMPKPTNLVFRNRII